MSDLLLSYWGTISTWMVNLGAEYGVDPYMFAFYYVGLAPVVWISAALAMRALKKNRPATPMISLCILTFLSPYFYIIYEGQSLPFWVYLLIVAVAILGSIKLYRTFSFKSDFVSSESLVE